MFPLCFICFWSSIPTARRSTTLAKKNRYSRDIHEIDPRCDHMISRDIALQVQRELVRADTVSRVDVEPQLDITRYHKIEVLINLMNFSAVTIFLARVV